MGIFHSAKGASGNSDTAGRGWTLTGVAGSRQAVKAIRKEWTAPPRGVGRFRAATRRPGQSAGGSR